MHDRPHLAAEGARAGPACYRLLRQMGIFGSTLGSLACGPFQERAEQLLADTLAAVGRVHMNALEIRDADRVDGARAAESADQMAGHVRAISRDQHEGVGVVQQFRIVGVSLPAVRQPLPLQFGAATYVPRRNTLSFRKSSRNVMTSREPVAHSAASVWLAGRMRSRARFPDQDVLHSCRSLSRLKVGGESPIQYPRRARCRRACSSGQPCCRDRDLSLMTLAAGAAGDLARDLRGRPVSMGWRRPRRN